MPELVVGRVGRPHGVRGLVVVEVRTDDPARRFAPGAVLATEPGGAGPLVVEGSRDHSGRLLVAFEGYPDRTAVETLRGLLLLVGTDGDAAAGTDGTHDADMADTDDGDDGDDGDDAEGWYDHELVGLQARLTDGSVVGDVVQVVHRPAQDALVVARADGVRVEVPFVTAIVPVVDVPGGHVVLDPPGGLLDPETLGPGRDG